MRAEAVRDDLYNSIHMPRTGWKSQCSSWCGSDNGSREVRAAKAGRNLSLLINGDTIYISYFFPFFIGNKIVE
jgi:hypothetical protein